MSAIELIVVFLGFPGVGKGVQARELCTRGSLERLSTGEILRDEIVRDTEVGRRVQALIDRGRFADDETVLGLVRDRLSRPGCRRGLVFDGFPRTILQARAFDDLLESFESRVHCAVFLEAPEATVLRRLCGRSVCADCSASYHDEFCRPRVESVCDRCGGALVRRPDDAIEHQRARLRTFLERTEPVLDHYRRQGVLRAVDAARSIEAVARDVHRLVALDRTSR